MYQKFRLFYQLPGLYFRTYFTQCTTPIFFFFQKRGETTQPTKLDTKKKVLKKSSKRKSTRSNVYYLKIQQTFFFFDSGRYSFSCDPLTFLYTPQSCTV